MAAHKPRSATPVHGCCGAAGRRRRAAAQIRRRRSVGVSERKPKWWANQRAATTRLGHGSVRLARMDWRQVNPATFHEDPGGPTKGWRLANWRSVERYAWEALGGHPQVWGGIPHPHNTKGATHGATENPQGKRAPHFGKAACPTEFPARPPRGGQTNAAKPAEKKAPASRHARPTGPPPLGGNPVYHATWYPQGAEQGMAEQEEGTWGRQGAAGGQKNSRPGPPQASSKEVTPGRTPREATFSKVDKIGYLQTEAAWGQGPEPKPLANQKPGRGHPCMEGDRQMASFHLAGWKLWVAQVGQAPSATGVPGNPRESQGPQDGLG